MATGSTGRRRTKPAAHERFELVEGTAPLKVVLTEAGLLAERYGSDRSAQFVRGTLGRLAEGLTG